MVRGNRKTVTFIDDIDRQALSEDTHARSESPRRPMFCVLPNGQSTYHLVLCTPRANLSWVMHRLNSQYAKYLNRRHNWTGHVFEGPLQRHSDRRRLCISGTPSRMYAAQSSRRRRSSRPRRTGNGAAIAQRWATAPRRHFSHCDWMPRLYEASTLQESRQLFAKHVAGWDESVSDPGLLRTSWAGTEFKRVVRGVIGATLYKAPLAAKLSSRWPTAAQRTYSTTREKEDRRVDHSSGSRRFTGTLMSEIARFLESAPDNVSRIVNQSGSYRHTRT